jgi:hypothetical protein
MFKSAQCLLFGFSTLFLIAQPIVAQAQTEANRTVQPASAATGDTTDKNPVKWSACPSPSHGCDTGHVEKTVPPNNAGTVVPTEAQRVAKPAEKDQAKVETKLDTKNN